ncbi:MAG: hypothetical protein MJ009_05650 [Paludibacteraceae bacterium]|nr:hypothetical protein [Paludibacteraceae bacterium]
MNSYIIDNKKFVSIEDLYDTIYAPDALKFEIGHLAVVLMVLATPSQNYQSSTEICSSNAQIIMPDLNPHKLDVGTFCNFSEFQLSVNRTVQHTREVTNYAHFYDSFCKNISLHGQRIVLEPLFSKMAKGLGSLKVKQSYVDTSADKIEFHLNLYNGVYVSALKSIDTCDDDMVTFTISANNEMITAGYMSMSVLNERLQQVQRSLQIV